ncbi:MAG: FAD-binding protein [Gaiellaceae bacterium MAG52_C11]|nr:FAD-binding protein [Candidatus Gaiellasilicea maunaloa]
MNESLRETLAGFVRVSDGDSERDLHAADMTFHRPHRPDLVVYPTSTAEVARTLEVANDRRVAVTPFGAVSSLEGHVIPTRGGLSLDLSRLDRIVEIAPSDPSATVDASTLAAINAYRGSSYTESPCLLVEAAGTEATVEADLVLVRELAEEEGATEIVDERDPAGRARLWAARHDAAWARSLRWSSSTATSCP